MKRKTRFIETTLLSVSLFFALTSPSIGQPSAKSPSPGSKAAYTLAVVPQFPPVEIHKRWIPFVEGLSKELGVNIQLKAYRSFHEFENDLKNGVPDFAYMNPYQVVVARKAQGYIPLIRDKKLVKAVIFVHKDSPIHSLQDLNNKEIAFVAPKTICSIVLRRELSTRKENIHFTPQFAGTASNVYRNVILGKIPAGGTLDSPLNREPSEVREQLRTVYETPPMASHPIIAHPRVPESLRHAVISAILRFYGDKANRDMLSGIQMPDPVSADYQKDYMPLESLGLEKYIIGGD